MKLQQFIDWDLCEWGFPWIETEVILEVQIPLTAALTKKMASLTKVNIPSVAISNSKMPKDQLEGQARIKGLESPSKNLGRN